MKTFLSGSDPEFQSPARYVQQGYGYSEKQTSDRYEATAAKSA